MFVPHVGADVSVHIQHPRVLRLEELLGSGGFAQVWRVQDRDSAEHYTLKVFQNIRPETIDAERIRREASLHIPSPHVVQPLGLHEFSAQGIFLILFEYVSARPLDQLLAAGSLSSAAKRQIFADVLAAVADAHLYNVIHRDLKPANILVTDTQRGRLIDLGVAKLKARALTVTGQMLGTFEYMAPEQFALQTVDARTDIYALGHVLYEMAMHQSFWSKMGWNLTDYGAYLTRTPPPRAIIDLSDFECDFFASAGEVLERMCRVEREQRYASVREVQQALGLLPVAPGPERARPPVGLAFAHLTVESGGNQGCQLPLNLQPGETRTYGRADLAGADDSISRQHLVFQRRPDGYYVRDCGSKNGTLLSGNALSPHTDFRPIRSDDRIKIGDHFLRFVLSAEA
jgi:serine/threonine protein kinase